MSYSVEAVREILSNLSVYEKSVWDKNVDETNVIEGYKAIRLNRDDKLIRLVSPDYNVIQHIDAFEATIKDLDELDLEYIIKQVYVNDFETRNGKRRNSIQVTFEFPELKFNVDGSDVNATLEIFNSNDTSLMFTRKFGAFRQACQNIMCMGKGLFYERFKHVGTNDLGNMAEAIKDLPNYLKDFGKLVEQTMTVTVDDKLKRGLVDLGFPKRLIDNLDVAADKYKGLVGEDASPEKLWGVYQVLTNWISNVVMKTNIERADRLGVLLYRFIQLQVANI